MDNYFSQEKKEVVAQQEVREGQMIQDVPILVRSSNSGDKIYLVKDGTKHWITSPQVLKALGFDFGQEKEIDKIIMANLMSGEPIRMENVNNYILPVPEVVEEKEVVEPVNEVENDRIEGYMTIVIPCILTASSVSNLTEYVANLKKYFSGEIISVVKNECDYKGYSPIFGNKVIECEDLNEGVERARRVARGEAIVCDFL